MRPHGEKPMIGRSPWDYKNSSTAFSLVELSIVLVILGLLTGGILGGQSLIRAAELRATTAQFGTYRAAAYSFRDKYFAFPGDLTNATAFWNSAGGTGGDSVCIMAQTAGSSSTCNGNGNGQINEITGVFNAERFLSWKHLANAGLVEGSYTGKTIGALGSHEVTNGLNAPAGKAGNSFFDFNYVFPNPAFIFSESRSSVNSIALYGMTGTSGALKPEEAWNIDAKFDDGSPVYGSIFSVKKSSSVSGDCASSDLATAAYDFGISGRNCLLFYTL